MANIDLKKLTLFIRRQKQKQVYQTDDKETYIVHQKMMPLHLMVKT